jgi:hypothetical protein
MPSDAILVALGGGTMQDRGYELPRILIPRTRVNTAYLRLGIEAGRCTRQRD